MHCHDRAQEDGNAFWLSGEGGGGESLKYWIECVDGLCRWWWVPMVGDSTIRFDVCRRDDDVARFDGWIPRNDDFGGFAMKILQGS